MAGGSKESPLLQSFLLAGALCISGTANSASAPRYDPILAGAPDMALVALVAPTSFCAVNPGSSALVLLLHDSTIGTTSVIAMPPRSGLESHFASGALQGVYLRVVARAETGLEVSRLVALEGLVLQGPVGFDTAQEEGPLARTFLPLFQLTSTQGQNAFQGPSVAEDVGDGSFVPPAPPHSGGVTPHGAKKEAPPKLEEQLPPL